MGRSSEGQVTDGRATARIVDASIAIALAVGTVLTFDRADVFHRPFWVDEAWVADSTRAPLSQLRLLTSSTPIGWTMLLRLVPHIGSAERLRAVPVAFSVAAVIAAYALGRALFDRRYHLALIPAAAIMLAPISLSFTSLKQYSAEAFGAVLLLTLAVRLERAWSPTRLYVLGAAAVLLQPFATTTIFAAAAIFGALFVVEVVRRTWDRVVRVTAAGAVIVAADAVLYLLVVKPDLNPALKHFWDNYYLAGNPTSGARAFIAARWLAVARFTGIGPLGWVVIVVVGGMVVLARRRAVAVALVPAALAAIGVIAGRVRLFPYLDLRTSKYFLTSLAAIGALAFSGAGAELEDLAERRGLLKRPWSAAIVSAVTIGAIALFIVHGRPYTPARVSVAEDVRDQVRLVEAARKPGDVIAMNLHAQWGYAYYERERPHFVPASDVSTGFKFAPDPSQNIVIAKSRTLAGERAAFDAARALQATHPGAHLWIILSHISPPEVAAWKQLAAPFHPSQRRFGTEMLLVL